MARISISDAARTAGISRQQFYKGYIRTGKINVCRNEDTNTPYIEMDELLRVFPPRTIRMTRVEQVESEIEKRIKKDAELLCLRKEVELLRERMADYKQQLSEALEREKRLNHHISEFAQWHVSAGRLRPDPRPSDETPT